VNGRGVAPREMSDDAVLAHWDAWARRGDADGGRRVQAASRVAAWLRAKDTDARLDLSGLGLDSVPAVWPSAVRCLDLGDNQIHEIPGTLPSRLHTLLLGGNRLERLPDLPPGVRTLHADRNRLSAIDTLPEGVRRLFVTRNALRTLKLPKDLQVLHADDNVLERLRVPRGLVMLSVPRNRLSALPEDVSETLAFIDAEDNDIHVLPQEAMSRVSPRCEILLAGNPLSSTTKAQLAQTMADARHHGPWISFS
jgi:Leucine-rich repeat (LRR) protein